MAYVVTFNDISAPAREDSVPWTRVQVEESQLQAGPWALIADMVLNPIDADPANPVARDLTVATATLPSGWYRIAFIDGDDNRSGSSEPVLNSPEGVLPTVRDIARRLLSRTRTSGGALVGTFDNRTDPITADRVQDLIEEARDEVYGRTGPLTDPIDVASARNMIVLYTAMLIELAFFSEQINTNRSPYGELKKLYDAGMAALIEGMGGDDLSARDDIPGEGQSNMASYDFPPTSIGDGVMP